MQAKIPNWLLVLLAVLGWNELLMVLSSPLICLLLTTLAAAAFGLNVLSPGLPLALAKARANPKTGYPYKSCSELSKALEAWAKKAKVPVS